MGSTPTRTYAGAIYTGSSRPLTGEAFSPAAVFERNDMLKNLTSETLGDLDNGLFGRLVDEELQKILADIDDRGHDGNKRQITITIDFQMDPSRDPHSPSLLIDPQVKSKVPPLRSGITIAKVGRSVKSGALAMQFRDDNRDNPEQPTLLSSGEEDAE